MTSCGGWSRRAWTTDDSHRGRWYWSDWSLERRGLQSGCKIVQETSLEGLLSFCRTIDWRGTSTLPSRSTRTPRVIAFLHVTLMVRSHFSWPRWRLALESFQSQLYFTWTGPLSSEIFPSILSTVSYITCYITCCITCYISLNPIPYDLQWVPWTTTGLFWLSRLHGARCGPLACLPILKGSDYTNTSKDWQAYHRSALYHSAIAPIVVYVNDIRSVDLHFRFADKIVLRGRGFWCLLSPDGAEIAAATTCWAVNRTTCECPKDRLAYNYETWERRTVSKLKKAVDDARAALLNADGSVNAGCIGKVV